MSPSIAHPLDIAFVFAVTAAAMLWPPAALAVAAGFYGLNAYLAHREARRAVIPEESR